MPKHVAPTHPGASIPDPARGRDLPPGGMPVEWSAYWAGLHRRGDVVVRELAEEAGSEPAVAPETGAEERPVSAA